VGKQRSALRDNYIGQRRPGKVIVKVDLSGSFSDVILSFLIKMCFFGIIAIGPDIFMDFYGTFLYTLKVADCTFNFA
jgi:hypothetical protein